jgi:transcription antitermination factor NusG
MRPSEHACIADSGLPCWYALYTRHQHEKSVEQFLNRKGFQVLLPLYRSERRWSDRKQVVSLPLFPNSLFIETDIQRRVEILRVPGVCWFVANSNGPIKMASEEIETVRKLSECPAKIEPYPYLECGSDVRVQKGPLAGLRGTLVRTKNGQRVIVSLTLLQKSAAVELDRSNLERIGNSRPTNEAPRNFTLPPTAREAEYCG